MSILKKKIKQFDGLVFICFNYMNIHHYCKHFYNHRHFSLVCLWQILILAWTDECSHSLMSLALDFFLV